ncbi:MAG: hypothetical protein IMW99_00535, partial [Firmicutes bacterium]|nr:hypothetical protein [Bacillota bacterium]
MMDRIEQRRDSAGPRQAARQPTVLAGAVGDCVHVAGVYNFLRLAEAVGFQTVFLGPAVPVKRFWAAIRQMNPLLVGVSYRLSPDAGERVLQEFTRAFREAPHPMIFAFGGTPPVAERARKMGFFHAIFDGRQDDRLITTFLRQVYKAFHEGALAAGPGGGAALARAGVWDHGGGGHEQGAQAQDGAVTPGPQAFAHTLVERIQAQAPYPLLRHHFGLPSLADTVAGVAELAERQLLDVISLAPDQNAQESFFRPQEMDPRQDGAGGVPVRSPEDFRALYEASRRGNYPLLRCYSGTRDLVRMAQMLKETIHLAWGAVPLFWYSQLDGRSSRPLAQAIAENQAAMAWHAQNGIPVEVNDPHHWSLRDAPDSVAVAAAYLAAYNARAAGVRDYVAQFMFNTPAATSFRMDLAKMLAVRDLLEELEAESGGNFRVWRQTRTGLASLPSDIDVAKGQLASSTLLQMALQPHIVHVVAHVEADHAATPKDIAEAVKIVRGVIRIGWQGLPDMTLDPAVQRRRQELVDEARQLLQAIASLAGPEVRDPLADSRTLALAVESGLLDAPHLAGNPAACGRVRTCFAGGACRAVDLDTGQPLREEERIERALDQWRRQQESRGAGQREADR